MQNTFEITYNNQSVEVEEKSSDQKNNKLFIVHLSQKESLELLLKQDNEGANHWFDSKTDQSTELTKQLGESIDAYLKNK